MKQPTVKKITWLPKRPKSIKLLKLFRSKLYAIKLKKKIHIMKVILFFLFFLCISMSIDLISSKRSVGFAKTDRTKFNRKRIKTVRKENFMSHCVGVYGLPKAHES